MMLMTQPISAEELIVVADEVPPTLDLLDYIAAMVEVDGELIGPAGLDESGDGDATVVADDDAGGDTWVTRDRPLEMDGREHE